MRSKASCHRKPPLRRGNPGADGRASAAPGSLRRFGPCNDGHERPHLVNGLGRWYGGAIMGCMRCFASTLWIRKILIAGASVFMIALRANAQQAPERYRCDLRDTRSNERLLLEFVYDRVQNKAFSIGNNGMSEVTALVGTKVITFVEYLSSGAVQTTSIDRKAFAVHSRHTYNEGFIQSQWLGTCK